MANRMYDLGREKFLTGAINWSSDTIKALCCDATYTPDTATHEFLSDIAGTARVGTAVTLASKTSTGGIAGCGNITFTGITGDQVTQVVFYKDSGVEATSALIALEDTVTGFPFTPNSGDLVLTVPATGNKLFKL